MISYTIIAINIVTRSKGLSLAQEPPQNYWVDLPNDTGSEDGEYDYDYDNEDEEGELLSGKLDTKVTSARCVSSLV